MMLLEKHFKFSTTKKFYRILESVYYLRLELYLRIYLFNSNVLLIYYPMTSD